MNILNICFSTLLEDMNERETSLYAGYCVCVLGEGAAGWAAKGTKWQQLEEMVSVTAAPFRFP